MKALQCSPPLLNEVSVDEINELNEVNAASTKGEGKLAIRQSLRASTLDGMFSSAFENIVRGVLISHFLLGLGAGAFEIGLLSSIPMMAHLLQPLGAYFSEKSTSRHLYCLLIYGTSRLLWLLPAAGIFLFTHGAIDAHALSLLTLAVLTVSNILDAVGCASWMSWMAALVPARIRGRYFSLRRSLASLTALLTIPVGGWLVSSWLGGEVEGYAIALIVAVIMGLTSLVFQFWMSDINPQAASQPKAKAKTKNSNSIASVDLVASVDSLTASQAAPADLSLLKNTNFLILLLFFGVWTFSVNLSAPFFNLYLLDTLHLNIQWVTLYNSFMYGAFFLTIMLWGRLADAIGNRPVLIVNCLLVASIALMWSYVGGSAVSLWLLLPLLHLLQGTAFAALDLCLANIQLELAPLTQQSTYFAVAAAVMGVTGALGTTAGSYLAELSTVGLPALFAITAVVRLVSIVPLAFVKEDRAHSIRHLLSQWRLLPVWQPVKIKAYNDTTL
ncbi:MAG: MFS transporter [Phormidesmis priestleyi]|uniref:MFS transporter n=1 Tax=Phormidesmis priestleyi TaxID=268141 RepID=A0A2W4XEE8_9CYAN|nr:MAG: MFS transporter [Phormidesmis priestleyi]